MNEARDIVPDPDLLTQYGCSRILPVLDAIGLHPTLGVPISDLIGQPPRTARVIDKY